MRERLKVENHDDGMMTITARVRAPTPRIAAFEVHGAEAVKRYKKWVVMVAAGFMAEFIPNIIPWAERYVEALGPDSDSTN